MLRAGDLGLSLPDVDSSVSSALRMCMKWNVVLLMDGADVLLEQRSAHNL